MSDTAQKRRTAPVDPAMNFLAVPEVRVAPLGPALADRTDAQLDVDVRLHGRRFLFRFDIPDVTGTIPVTDVDRQRILSRIMDGIGNRFGRLRLRSEL